MAYDPSRQSFVVASNRRRRKRNPERYLWESARDRASKLGIPFDIEVSDIQIPRRCPVFGFKIKVYHKTRDKKVSLDRVIPSLGYVKGNIAVISFKANRLKNNGSIEEILALAKWLKRMM